ncbi:carboxylesterase family protein [Actinomadura barringtoniae]|uniref:Carboxylic ester hydrolase n=1 Tax=Actinomadura barringtoniae TaxID=1427535 RepID=A0A939T6W6_9ACTN|nr:carboxylesterase family protein [Actinomadura barringtoniae]MBO2455421.1 carboxylesterase family protein [Actinomadura barringtoniae]
MMMPGVKSASIVAAVVSAMGLAGACKTSQEPLTVRVDSGSVRGVLKGDAREFLGIPYAAPPVGGLRWTLPRKPQPWSGVRASRASKDCKQAGKQPSSEDCLYVNVTAPRKRRGRLPVMVWWHGGGFTQGSGKDYDAVRLATEGKAIVVTVNYRLGIFGYLGLPGLKGSGDFGLADQIAALKWARRNASAFGGDPHNITVFGQSAGAMSACALLASPEAKGLVDKAIISSGSCRLRWPAGGLFPGAPADRPYVPVKQGQEDGLAAAKELKCGDVACLRRKSADELLPQSASFSDHLAYGTALLPRDPAVAPLASVPVMIGGTRDEARSFVGGAINYDPKLITAKTYPRLLAAAFGKDAGKVAAKYPLSRYRSAGPAWAAVLTDGSWACSALATARGLRKVYSYEFADENAPNVNGIKIPGFPMGAAHASDLPYLFDLGGRDLLVNKERKGLARTMIGYWSAFARSGDPNHRGAPRWRPGLAPLSLAPGAIRTIDAASEHNCAFWKTTGVA